MSKLSECLNNALARNCPQTEEEEDPEEEEEEEEERDKQRELC